MSTHSPTCSWARSNRPCQAVNASIGTHAASTWVSRAGLGAIADGGARQNSAVAPCAYQSFMPNTSWPTMPSASTPTAAMAPENSCPGMAWRRFSPDLGCVGGCHNSSVWGTPTAWTRIKASARWGSCVLTSACTSPGTGRESSHCQTFILHLVVKVDSCSGQQGHVELGLRDDPPSTGQLLHHPRLRVLLQFAAVGAESADALGQLLGGHGILVVHPAKRSSRRGGSSARRTLWPCPRESSFLMGEVMVYSFAVAVTAPGSREPLTPLLETDCPGPGADGGLANKPSNPSAAVGWVQIVSRRTVYGMPPSMAVWATAMSSLASAPS